MSTEDECKKENINEESINDNLNNELKIKELTKELIKKLLKDSLDNSLSKLELNTENQNKTLKSLSKTSSDFSTKVSNLINKVNESINKKEQEKKKEHFKNSKKMASTQTNFRKKNDTINSNLLASKTKKLKSTTNNQSTSNFNTLNNSKITNDKSRNVHKFQTIANRTQQSFKKIYTTGPSTPTKKKDKLIEKNKNEILKEKENKYKILTNKVNDNKTKKVIKPEFNRSFSKSFTRNPLSNNSEKIENKTISISRTKTNVFKFKKDIKGMLFKKVKKEINKLEKGLNVIEERDEKIATKEITKTIFKNPKIDHNNKKDKNKLVIPEDKIIKEKEEIIKKQKEIISKLSEELNNYKKDTRHGIFIIRQNKTMKISKNLITINDEIVILMKCEPLQYYDSYYYLINYEVDKLKSKEIYLENKKLEDNEYIIEDKYYVKINFEKAFNDETRKIKVIYEIPNEFFYYSSYGLGLNKKDVLMKYEIIADDDIQIDGVTNEYFKLEKNGNMALFEGKTTNEIIVQSGKVIFSRKINYQIYKYIPKYENKESEIIKLKETNNEITLNILAKYKKVNITNYGQEIEDLFKIKISNYESNTYLQNYSYPLLMNTKCQIELVEINGEKVKYSMGNSSIKILKFGAFKNQFAEIHLKYKYLNEDKDNNNTLRQEVIITSGIKNSYCKLIIKVPEEYVILSTNDIFPKSKSNNNEYIFEGISKENELKEFVKFSTKKGKWNIQKEITLEGKENIQKCKFEVNRIFKGGNLKTESYEITKGNAEFIEDLKQNKYIFNYNNLNTNKINIEWNIKAENSTSNYIFDGNKDLIIKIPKEDKNFFKNLSNEILKKDKSNFPNYKKLGKWVYNYMTYNSSYKGKEISAREIYNKKNGVCEHFSLLYNTLLTAQNIKVIKVTGYALSEQEQENNDNQNILENRRHAWSLALIDGEWVPLDATWNLFEKNVPLTHIFQNYGDCTNLTTSYGENKVQYKTTKEIIKYIES